MHNPWSRHLSEYSFTLLFILFGNVPSPLVPRTKVKRGKIKQPTQSPTVLRRLSQEQTVCDDKPRGFLPTSRWL